MSIIIFVALGPTEYPTATGNLDFSYTGGLEIDPHIVLRRGVSCARVLVAYALGFRGFQAPATTETE